MASSRGGQAFTFEVEMVLLVDGWHVPEALVFEFIG